MKKSLLILSAISLFALAGCGQSQQEPKPEEPEIIPPVESEIVESDITLAEFNTDLEKQISSVPTSKTSLGYKTEFLDQLRYDFVQEENSAYQIIHTHTKSTLFVDNGISHNIQDNIYGQKLTYLDAAGEVTSSYKMNQELKEDVYRQTVSPFSYYQSEGFYKVTNNPTDPLNPDSDTRMDYKLKCTKSNAQFNENTNKLNSYNKEERSSFLLNSLKAVNDFAKQEGSTLTFHKKHNNKLDTTVYNAQIRTITDKEITGTYKSQDLTMNFEYTIADNFVSDFYQEVKLNGVLADGTKVKDNQSYTIAFIECPELTFPEIPADAREPKDALALEPSGIIPFGFNHH